MVIVHQKLQYAEDAGLIDFEKYGNADQGLT